MRINGTILSLMALIMVSCTDVEMTDDLFTTVRLSISTEMQIDTKAGIIDEETTVDEVIFVVFSKDDGSCIWSGSGDDAEFSCRKGTQLRLIALCNYHDLLDTPMPGESMETFDNETLDWEIVCHKLNLLKVIPMYGEVDLMPIGNQESVSIVVKRICNKVLIAGTVRASGDVSAEGVDFYGTDSLAVLLSHSPSILRLNGTPVPDCDELPDMELSADLCADLFENGFIGAYFPAGLANTLVFQFEHANMTWHYPVSIGGSDTNTEYKIQGIAIGRFIDWDEQWMRSEVGIKVSEWKMNHSINETL